MLEVCSGVTNEKEKDGEYKRSGRFTVGPRVMGAPLCAKCLSMYSRFEPIGSVVMC